MLGAAPAAAEPVPDIPPVTDAQIAASVVDIEPRVRDIEANVRDVETSRNDGSQTVVSLSTDVLFEFGKAELPPSAPARLGQLLTTAPRGGGLEVHGFTDSIGSPVSNLTLSRARADAVAAAVRSTRPDLVLAVDGFGEDRPVAPNTVGGKDDPEGEPRTAAWSCVSARPWLTAGPLDLVGGVRFDQLDRPVERFLRLGEQLLAVEPGRARG